MLPHAAAFANDFKQPDAIHTAAKCGQQHETPHKAAQKVGQG